MIYFQDMIAKLSEFWAKKGCAILQPYDMEVGAGTFHPATFFGSLGPEATIVSKDGAGLTGASARR